MAQNLKTKLKIVAIAAVCLAVGAVLWLLLRSGKEPAQEIDRFWAERRIDKPNAILFSLDTTRADPIGCYGYAAAKTPHLDALAQRGVLFEQAEG